MTKKVLVICTSHDKLGSRDEPTGLWLEELAAPYLILTEAGYEVVVASVQGGKIPLDPNSLTPDAITPEAAKFQQNETYMGLLAHTNSFTHYKAEDFVAVFLPGGHGTSFDLPDNQQLSSLLSSFYVAGKVVAAVCHGPVGLVNVKDAHGEPIVKGKQVAAFSDAEEHAVGKADVMPFMLETRLKELGALYTAGPNWAPHAVRDGNLVTGQNPASSSAVAKLIVEALHH